jgi:hypothetical protein
VSTLNLYTRLLIFYKTLQSIDNYFAHRESIKNFNLEKLYKRYIKRVTETKDRYLFGLVMMEFISELKNGHSWYFDPWLYKIYGNSLRFHVFYHDYERKWIIDSSSRENVKIGRAIQNVNGTTAEKFFKGKTIYINASSEREARNKLFLTPFLLTGTKIGLDSGEVIRVKRFLDKPDLKPLLKIIDDKIVYIKIPSFSSGIYAKTAFKYIKKHIRYKNIIIDIRNNDGGATPLWLLKLLMNKKYRRFNYCIIKPKTSLSIMYGRNKKKTYGIVNYPSEYKDPYKNAYNGNLAILVNEGTVSAAEDFLFSFKDNKRATIFGTKTAGTDGDPYICTFPNGISIAIGSVLVKFPDGSRFEGRGIKPDIEVCPSIEDIKMNKDVILQKAIYYLNSR